MPQPQTEPNGVPSPRTALRLCHRCIAGMLERLESLAGELASPATGTPDAGQAARARAHLPAFDAARNGHVADEETDIFPALLAACDAPARRAQAFELVSSLLVEHREIAELWHALRIPLLALAGGVAIAFPGGTAADFLVQLRRHLEREDLELADLMSVLDASHTRTIAIAIALRHDEACPRARNCPLDKP